MQERAYVSGLEAANSLAMHAYTHIIHAYTLIHTHIYTYIHTCIHICRNARMYQDLRLPTHSRAVEC